MHSKQAYLDLGIQPRRLLRTPAPRDPNTPKSVPKREITLKITGWLEGKGRPFFLPHSLTVPEKSNLMLNSLVTEMKRNYVSTVKVFGAFVFI